MGRMAGQSHAKSGWKAPAFIVVLALLVIAIVLLAGVFTVQEVNVLGTRFRTPAQVVGTSGIRKGGSMFLLDKNRIATSIDADPFLGFEGIYLDWPHTVNLVVTERQPFASLTWLGTFALLDSEGVVLQRSDTLDTSWDLPVVSGLEITGLREGVRVQARRESQVEQMVLLFQALQHSPALSLVKEITVVDANDLSLITHDEMKVSLGSLEMIDQKLGILQVVDGQLSQTEKHKATLDVSTGVHGDYRPMVVINTMGGPDPIRNPYYKPDNEE